MSLYFFRPNRSFRALLLFFFGHNLPHFGEKFAFQETKISNFNLYKNKVT
jgi:hypothetical protein